MVHKQQLEHPQGRRPRSIVIDMINYLTAKHKEFNKTIDYHISANDDMKATVELLMSMRGCGRILALTLITDLPKLGTLDRRQIAAPCGAVGSPQPHAASAWRPSPGTADSEKTSASSKAAEAKSATSPTWPPSAPAAPKTIPSRPVPSPDRPRQTQKARHRRRHARHDHDPRRHAQGQQAVEPRPRSLIKTTVAEESTNEPEWTGYRGRDCSSILRQRVGVVFSQNGRARVRGARRAVGDLPNDPASPLDAGAAFRRLVRGQVCDQRSVGKRGMLVVWWTSAERTRPKPIRVVSIAVPP